MAIRHGERHDGDGLTYRAIRHIQAQPKLDMPAILCLDSVNDSGVIATWYFWMDHTGAFRRHSALPTNQDLDGVVFGVAAGVSATLALDNLAAVAINASLVADSSNDTDLGTAALPWRRAYLGTSAVFGLPAGNTLTLAYAVPAVSRVVTFQDPGAAADVAYVGVSQTLLNKTLTSPVLTLPEINNLALTFQYIVTPSAIAADRVVTLPLLAAPDTFVFEAFIQTLTNKTIDGDDNTLTDIPIASLKAGVQGDVIYFNGTNWVRLGCGVVNQYLKTGGAGANPSWDQPTIAVADHLGQNTVCEAGVNDYTIHFNAPAAARHLDIQDPLGNDEFVFVAAAQTLTNKTLTTPVLTTPQINNPALTFQYEFVGSAILADRAVTLPLLIGGDTFVFEAHIQTLTNKTLTSPVLTTPEINNIAGTFQYVFAGSAILADRTVTLPLLIGGDTFVFEGHIQTLTNKTLTSPVLTTPEINNLAGTFQYVVTPSAILADWTVTLPLLLANDVFVFEAFIQSLGNKTMLATCTWNGAAVGPTYGGTGITGYAIGDLLYADTAATLAKLADVAVGQYLASGGVGVAPAWATLNQAAVAGLTTASSPIFAGLQVPSPIFSTSVVFKNPTRNLTLVWNEPAVAPRSVTFGDPGADDYIAYLAAHQIFENKDLESTCEIVDVTDNTKALAFNLAGATGGAKLTLVASPTTNKSLTLPDAVDTLVGKATTDVLSNKTLASPLITGVERFTTTPDVVTDTAAVSLTTSITHLVTTQAAIPTLAAGTEGQLKYIMMKTYAVGSAVLTPTPTTGFGTITFSAVGQAATLLFTNGYWVVVGYYGCVVA